MIKPPEYAALINTIAGNAFALRYAGRKDFVRELTVETGAAPYSLAPISINLFDGPLDELSPADSMMFVAPFVKIATAVPADWAARLLISRFTVALEDQTIVDKGLLEKFLVIPPFQSAETSSPGQRLVYVGRSEDALLGGNQLFFTSQKPTLKMLLEGIPAGIGVIHMIYGVIFGHYTTRLKTGSLFEVGELDAQQQCLPITTCWSKETPRGDITEDRLERSYGDVLKGLLQEKEMEIRRLKEDADLKEKAEKRRLELEDEKKQKAITEVIEDIKKRHRELLGEPMKLSGQIGVRPDEMPVVLRPEGKQVADARVDHLHAPVNFEAALARAKRRLIRWGIIATLALAAAAFAIRFLILKT